MVAVIPSHHHIKPVRAPGRQRTAVLSTEYSHSHLGCWRQRSVAPHLSRQAEPQSE